MAITSIHGRRLGIEVGTDDLVILGGLKKASGAPVAMLPKLPTYTVATVPSASTAGAGTLIYVSNGLAGAPCVAVSNGTSWISPAGTAVASS